MIGCNKLAKMSYKMQSFAEGPDKNKFMGGKAFIGKWNYLFCTRILRSIAPQSPALIHSQDQRSQVVP